MPDHPPEERFVASDGFDLYPGPRVLFGPGRVDRLGGLVREFGGTHALLCTDEGVKAAGHAERAVASLVAAGVTATVWDDVRPNPSTADVDRGVAIAEDAGVDFLIGFGGGSSMDAAKGVNLVLSGGGPANKYWGVGKAEGDLLPSIGVPTTSGTGSEGQSFALISDAETGAKMACGDRRIAFKAAVLDPELTLSMPRSVSVATGIDAIAHAVETHVTKPRSAVSGLFARRAWGLLAHSFPLVLDHPDDVDARGSMLLGSYFAGCAIENSMLGATHALANPITARFGSTHGEVIGALLPHVIRFNADPSGPPGLRALYAELAADIGLEVGDARGPERLADHLAALFARAENPTRVTEFGVTPERFAELSEDAVGQWTANFNPRTLQVADAESIYAVAS
ncbi:MAG: iron-containing alcohol dehydrogenase [Planctomycetota bacterium]